ncbi:unnamed protein product [Cyprideis torosa]|uniref:GAF domain-containing protein n=1 Tax=Cyprideis torosa TaxID=163714 RepID=A0A7R8ZRP4_9CRUS|nr:unnamed protein product [Cyprideis torosa]CAG0893674.1 unnamed protein product [Cyprideis torosa]
MGELQPFSFLRAVRGLPFPGLGSSSHSPSPAPILPVQIPSSQSSSHPPIPSPSPAPILQFYLPSSQSSSHPPSPAPIYPVKLQSTQSSSHPSILSPILPFYLPSFHSISHPSILSPIFPFYLPSSHSISHPPSPAPSSCRLFHGTGFPHGHRLDIRCNQRRVLLGRSLLTFCQYTQNEHLDEAPLSCSASPRQNDPPQRTEKNPGFQCRRGRDGENVAAKTSLLNVAKNLFKRLDNVNSLLKEIMFEAKYLTKAERCSLFLVDEERKELVAKVWDGTEDNHEVRLPLTKGIVGHVARTGKLLNIRDAYSHPLFYKGMDKNTGFRTR